MDNGNRAIELHAELRELAFPLEKGHELALASAVETVREMRTTFNKFAEDDPYETGEQPKSWDLSAPLDESDPGVQLMTRLFLRILNRNGLLKIDPA
jgi:hypothetical protein